MSASNRDYVMIRVDECPRCNADHMRIDAERFVQPTEGHEYWAECPVTRQPILVRKRESYEDKGGLE